MAPTYFARLPAYSPTLGAKLVSMADRWYQGLPGLRPYQRARRVRNLYYGLPSGTSPFDITSVAMMGEQGELSAIQVNRLHHLGQRLLTMAGTDDFGWQPVTANGDTQSQEEAILAGSVLEHEKRASKLQNLRHTFDELAILDGFSYFSVRWDPAAGDKYDEIDGASVYEGRLKTAPHSWWRTVMDTNRRDANHDWLILTEFVNRWDLAERYGRGSPALYEKLASLTPENRLVLQWQEAVRGRMWDYDTDPQVPVYTLFHKRTPAVPDGREVIFVADGTILWDGPSVYGDELPVYRVASANVVDTPFGVSPLADVVALQQVVNMMFSTMTTNAVNHGVTNIAVRSQANLSRSQWDGANIWEVENPKEDIQSLDLVKVSGEVKNLAEMLLSEMTTLMGFNSVSLGMQEHQMSGTLAALLDSKSIQYASLFIAGDRQGVTDLGTAIIDRYRRFARAPRTLEVIAGEGRRYMLPDFVGADIGDIKRVTVEARNGVMSTVSGKMAFAETLVQSGVLENPNPLPLRVLTSVYTRGNLDVALMPVETSDMLMARENDMLAKAQSPVVRATDPHVEHILKHREVEANPSVRENEAVSAAVNTHIQEHIMMLRTLDPALLKVLGQPALGLEPGMPPPPQDAMAPPPGAPMEGLPPEAPNPEAGLAAQMDPALAAEMPNMPSLPEPPPGALPA